MIAVAAAGGFSTAAGTAAEAAIWPADMLGASPVATTIAPKQSRPAVLWDNMPTPTTHFGDRAISSSTTRRALDRTNA